MNSSSKVIMAATMVMVVSLVMVLCLVLVLLAELYCSLLLDRRRRLPTTTTISADAPATVSLTQIVSTSDPCPSLPQSKADTACADNLVYISNPVYSTSKPTTPFETPQSSPSRLDIDIEEDSTPALTPMKDLPEKACSVSLNDNVKMSLETSASGGSSSSSASPYASPSW